MSLELAMLAGCFLFVMAAVSACGYYFLRRPQTEAEVSRIGDESGESAQASLAHTFRMIGEAMPVGRSATNPVRQKLSAAGYRQPSAAPVFYGVKCSAAWFGALLAAWIVLLTQESLMAALIPAGAAAGFFYLLPDHLLRRIAASRARRLRAALPPAMDLMVLGLEAGQPLDQAMFDASRELRRAYPDLAAEFALVHLELRAGNSRMQVLQNLAERNDDAELRKMVNLIVDGDRFGTSLGPALRSHARHTRMRRRQQAQETARKVSVKLVFPVFFLIFPSVLLVTLGPAVLQLYTTLLPMLSQ